MLFIAPDTLYFRLRLNDSPIKLRKSHNFSYHYYIFYKTSNDFHCTNENNSFISDAMNNIHIKTTIQLFKNIFFLIFLFLEFLALYLVYNFRAQYMPFHNC